MIFLHKTTQYIILDCGSKLNLDDYKRNVAGARRNTIGFNSVSKHYMHGPAISSSNYPASRDHDGKIANLNHSVNVL